MDDLQARLDRTITAKWTRVHRLRMGSLAHWEDALNDYAALVALRARYEEHRHFEAFHGIAQPCCYQYRTLTAEAERLLGEDA